MKKINANDLINWWLEKYYNTTLEKILEENPEWKENPREHTKDFYKKYAVTQEQHDEWEKWAKEYIRKVAKVSKSYLNRAWWSIFLNISPIVKHDKND